MEVEEGCSSSSAEQCPESFKFSTESQFPLPKKELEIYKNSTAMNSARLRRKRYASLCLPRSKTVSTYDHPKPLFTIKEHTASEAITFHHYSLSKRSPFKERRSITTIHEEVFQYKKNTSLYSRRKMKSKGKNNNEKVASLKVIINRLKKTSLTNPDVLQNQIPEETIQLFKRIHL